MTQNSLTTVIRDGLSITLSNEVKEEIPSFRRALAAAAATEDESESFSLGEAPFGAREPSVAVSPPLAAVTPPSEWQTTYTSCNYAVDLQRLAD